MSIITLITDYGWKDHFVGILKGKLFSHLPEGTIVDISHSVDKFNLFEASYLLDASYNHFPKGSVHIMTVDAAQTNENKHVALLHDGHFFVGADNGVFGNLLKKDVFAMVATHLAKGGSLNVIGKESTSLKKLADLNPVIDEQATSIKGNVIYIDDFGNCVTNISKKLIDDTAKGRKYTIRFSNKRIENVKKHYADFKNTDSASLKNQEGNNIAIFNENELLEIAIYRSNPHSVGSASSLLGLRFRDVVTVEFK
jgi:S-adenosylmethionine hydrolase